MRSLKRKSSKEVMRMTQHNGYILIMIVIFGVTPIILFEYLMILSEQRGGVNKWICSLYTQSKKYLGTFKRIR